MSADEEDLEDVPYVGAERAADILAAVDDVEPEPLVGSATYTRTTSLML